MTAIMNPRALPGLLEARCAKSPGAPAFLSLLPGKQWQPVSWEEFAQGVTRVGEALGRGWNRQR